MFSFFKKRKHIFLNKNEKLIDLKIHLSRNFRGKFRNMSLKYDLITNQGKKVFRARVHKYQDLPEREWKAFNYLKKKGFNFVPQKVYYYRPLNFLCYSEIPGASFEEMLSQKKIGSFLKFTSQIAKALNNVHLKKGPKLPVKTLKQEKKERRHWFFLMRKCAPYFYSDFFVLLKRIWVIRQNNLKLFLKPKDFRLVHSDFHWGNVIKSKKKFYFIDFSYAFYGDPLEDVGGFLAQNDSMFSYYAPQAQQKKDKIRELFIENYFSQSLSKSETIRLFYFEIQKILEMASILAFVEPNLDNKKKGLKTLLKRAQKRLKELENLV